MFLALNFPLFLIRYFICIRYFVVWHLWICFLHLFYFILFLHLTNAISFRKHHKLIALYNFFLNVQVDKYIKQCLQCHFLIWIRNTVRNALIVWLRFLKSILIWYKVQKKYAGLFFDSSGSAIFFSQYWYENEEANVFRILLIIVFKIMPDVAHRTFFRFFHKSWVWRAKHIEKKGKKRKKIECKGWSCLKRVHHVSHPFNNPQWFQALICFGKM